MTIMTQLELLSQRPTQLIYGPFISREQAIRQGLSHYFTGKPCRNGHVSIRGVKKWNCLQCDRLQKAQERLRDPVRVRANERRTAANHRESKAEAVRKWRERNPKKVKEYARIHRRRYRTDAEYRERKRKVYNLHAQLQRDMRTHRAISANLRCRVHCALLRTSASRAFSNRELMGCSAQQLRNHLEAQFTDGMSWGNYGLKGWHIDHIRPCASFDLTDPEQQRQCFHYTNLQPLWAADNIRKRDKWQPPEPPCKPATP
jgi:hypothetical protein